MRPLRRNTMFEPVAPVVLQQELSNENPQPPSGLFRFLVLLWDRRSTALAIILSLTVATAIITLLIPNRYQSTARLMPPDKAGSDVMAMAALLGRAGATGGLANIASDIVGGKSTGALIVGVLQSQTMQDEIIRRFDLKRVYGETKDEDARAVLSDRTDISEDRKSGIVEISVRDHDRDRAAAMAQAYVDHLQHLLATLNTSSAHQEREFLEQRLVVVRGELDSAAKNLSEFSTKHGAIDLKEQGRAIVDASATLQGQLIAVEAEKQGLAQFYTPENARMRAISARISELRSQLQKIGGTPGVPSAGSGSSDYPTLRGLPVLGLTYSDLYRELKVREAVYETLTQQYELARVAEAKDIPSIKVLDTPRPAQKKVWPPRLLIIAMGFLLSIGIAAAWLLLEARWASLPSGDAHRLFVAEVTEVARGWGRNLRRTPHRSEDREEGTNQ